MGEWPRVGAGSKTQRTSLVTSWSRKRSYSAHVDKRLPVPVLVRIQQGEDNDSKVRSFDFAVSLLENGLFQDQAHLRWETIWRRVAASSMSYFRSIKFLFNTRRLEDSP